MVQDAESYSVTRLHTMLCQEIQGVFAALWFFGRVEPSALINFMIQILTTAKLDRYFQEGAGVSVGCG